MQTSWMTGSNTVAKFRAIFASSLDLIETDYYTVFALAAADLRGAEAEALQLSPPPGANLIKIFEDGAVARRVWLSLDQ